MGSFEKIVFKQSNEEEGNSSEQETDILKEERRETEEEENNTEAEKNCPYCGKPVKVKGHFCGYCGESLLFLYNDYLEDAKEGLEHKRELKSKIEDTIREMAPKIEERMNNFGVDDVEEETKTMTKKMLMDAHQQLTMLDYNSFYSKKGKAISLAESDDNLKKPENNELKKDVLDHINNLTFAKFVETMVKKMDGILRFGVVSGTAIDFITKAYSGLNYNLGGIHNTIFKYIEIYFINSNSFDDIKSALQHELTHFCLTNLTPEKRWRDILSMKKNRDKGEQTEEEKDNLKAQNYFNQLLLDINESVAHLSEVFSSKFSKARIPDYQGYEKFQGMNSVSFKKFYEIISPLIENTTAKDFDEKIAYLYKFAVAQWKEKLTMEEVIEITEKFVAEVNKIKTNN